MAEEDPKSNSLYYNRYTRKYLVKVVIRNPEENMKVISRLIRKYKPGSAQFFVYLTKQQIAALKGAYGNKISIIYGELLKKDRFDKIPKDLRKLGSKK